MKHSWPWWLLVLVIILGVGLWPFATGSGQIAASEAGRQAQAVEQQELFNAVDSWLKAANVQAPDLPKAVLKVVVLPSGHFLVHMQMQLGEGWFEVWRDGDKWQVKGAQPPR